MKGYGSVAVDVLTGVVREVQQPWLPIVANETHYAHGGKLLWYKANWERVFNNIEKEHRAIQQKQLQENDDPKKMEERIRGKLFF